MRNIRFIGWLVLTLIAAAPVSAGEPNAATGQVPGDTTAAAQAWEMIDDGVLVIDVRSPEEYAAGHLEQSVNVPHTEIDRLARVIGPDHSRPFVLYCRSGRRSGQALSALAERGYTDGFNASGLQALEATRPGDSAP